MGQYDDDDKKPLKVLVDFESDSFELYNFKGIERKWEVDKEAESGVCYSLIIKTNIPPFNKVYKYATEELRDEKWELLREKLKGFNVVFI